MTWLSALSIGAAGDVVLAIAVILFARADRRYQAEKLARLRAEGIYRPVEDDDWILSPVSGAVLDGPVLPELPEC